MSENHEIKKPTIAELENMEPGTVELLPDGRVIRRDPNDLRTDAEKGRDWEFQRKQIESLEEELATAEAENGRLVEVLERCERLYCDKAAERAKLSRDQHDSDCFIRDALSSSNALDYWQGEIREAEAKGVERASDILRIGREEHYCCDETCSTYQIIANKIGTLALDLRKSNQSNQSEGEKERKP